MQFTLIDRITELETGVRIQAVKGLALSEDYLQDHFPQFPVMPGVLMLEAMYEASAWLIRHSEDFAHSMVTLNECRNIKYADFVQPGRQLLIEADVVKSDDVSTTLKTKGTVDGKTAVQARLRLERFNWADQDEQHRARDEHIIVGARERFRLLYRPVTA